MSDDGLSDDGVPHKVDDTMALERVMQSFDETFPEMTHPQVSCPASPRFPPPELPESIEGINVIMTDDPRDIEVIKLPVAQSPSAPVSSPVVFLEKPSLYMPELVLDVVAPQPAVIAPQPIVNTMVKEIVITDNKRTPTPNRVRDKIHTMLGSHITKNDVKENRQQVRRLLLRKFVDA